MATFASICSGVILPIALIAFGVYVVFQAGRQWEADRRDARYDSEDPQVDEWMRQMSKIPDALQEIQKPQTKIGSNELCIHLPIIGIRFVGIRSFDIIAVIDTKREKHKIQDPIHVKVDESGLISLNYALTGELAHESIGYVYDTMSEDSLIYSIPLKLHPTVRIESIVIRTWIQDELLKFIPPDTMYADNACRCYYPKSAIIPSDDTLARIVMPGIPKPDCETRQKARQVFKSIVDTHQYQGLKEEEKTNE